MTKLDIEPLHPKQFRELNKCSIYQMHRWSGYPVGTIKNWLSSENSKRYERARDGVCYHFGTLHKLINYS